MEDAGEAIQEIEKFIANVSRYALTLEAENADLRSGEYLARVIEERDRYRKALDNVALVAGNLPYDILCRATGANDARYRGGLVCAARDIARAALEASNEPT